MIEYVVGIDYSMSCPSICAHKGTESWSLSNCKFYFLTNKKRNILKDSIFYSNLHKDFITQEERFHNISEWALSVIPENSIIGIEDYAFAAKGVVFNIGECTGLLKHKLWKSNFEINTFPPSTIKKFATGKGNSNKIGMYESFVKETNFHIDKKLLCKIGDSPLSDVIDSYYIAKLAHSNFSK
ncbi:hypothetical protein UFOVP410_83 [uncultured Caudovirales phage]|uniref:Uncharacterized protein n=1 Tax=uncultured Caudovirales phage TaxID=2100421 RepID=A0A6J5M3B2_9CAUD|nr:hypothetical protein UFOVP410_83 [uncultured Caudovirales phage]